MKLKEFVAETHLPESIVKGVVRQIGGWDEFKERAEDVAGHGAGGGFGGFTYYSDTVRFTEKHEADLLRMANEMANEMGVDTAADLIAGFNCLDLNKFEVYNALHCYNPKVDDEGDRTQVYNALAWFALEEVCRAYVDVVNAQ